jgi:hypothetical protein
MKALSITIAAMLMAATPVLAQDASKAPGVDPGTTKPVEVEVPERGSLPAAGNPQGSAAPGMANDCTKDPSKCSEPVTTTGSNRAPGMPEQSK